MPFARQPLLGEGSVFEIVKTFSKQHRTAQTGVLGLSLKTMYRKVDCLLKLLGCRATGHGI